MRATTPKGEFGEDIRFKEGLNILRAENSYGKSTVINSILFGLGLEGAYTPEHAPPLPPSMTSALDWNGERLPVTASHVGLEITNHNQKKLTIVRRIEAGRGSTLMSTWPEHVLDSNQRENQRDFLVRVPGAAQHETGFHHFLAQYLGLDLPHVERFDKPPTVLYLELLVPFFFVEQKLGWSGIVKQNSSMGIRGAFQRAFEFIDALETREVREKRLHTSEILTRAVHEWKTARQMADAIARSVNGEVRNIPGSPSNSPFTARAPILVTLRANTELPIEKEIQRLQGRLREPLADEAPPVSDVVESKRLELVSKTEALAKVEAQAAEISNALSQDEAELAASERRKTTVEADLIRYKSLVRLRSRGSSLPIPLEIRVCPTCSHELHDTVMPNDASFPSLSIDDNIRALDEQKESLVAIRTALGERARKRARLLRSTQERADVLRAEIRAVKESLVAHPRTPALDKLRERVRAEEEVKRLRAAKDSFDIAVVRLQAIAEEHAAAEKDLRALPQGAFSPKDESKLRFVDASVKTQLNEYGFSSIKPPAHVDLDWDTYKLVSDGNDITLGVSASDMVRATWAYLVAQLELAREHETNHPNLLILDEPSQQKAKDVSVSALVRRLAAARNASQQVILATSEPPERWSSLHAGDFSYVELTERLLKPVRRGLAGPS